MDRARAFFGSPAQRSILKRGADVRAVTRDLTHLTYYGRTVGIASSDDATLDTVLALARLQGNSNIADVSDADMPALISAAQDMGYAPVHYAKWTGGDASLRTARHCVAERPLPDGYLLQRLTPDTSLTVRQSLADTCLACGVLPPRFACCRARCNRASA